MKLPLACVLILDDLIYGRAKMMHYDDGRSRRRRLLRGVMRGDDAKRLTHVIVA